MSIYFIGNESDLYTVNAALFNLNNEEELESHIIDSINLKSIKTSILIKSPQYLIFSVSSIENTEETIDTIYDISKSIGVKTIAIIDNQTEMDSKIVKSLLATGVYIINGNLTEKKEKLISIFTGTYENFVNEEEILKERDLAEKQLTDKYDLPTIKLDTTIQKQIAVVGSMPRIGTTTVALQIIKFIQAMGARACYIEHNTNEYIEALEKYRETTKDPQTGSVIYKDVALYKDATPFAKGDSQNYDYIIHDYGNVITNKVDKTSVGEKDIIVGVSGIKPDEIEHYEGIYKSFKDYNFYVVFNFVPENEKLDVLEQQDEMRENTIFTGFSPDMFILSPENVDIFSDMLQKAVPIKKIKESKWRLFRRGGK